jgi:Sec-independent protein translocase protein TatA
MIWNFISWAVIIGVILAIFEADKIPMIKKLLDKLLDSKKKTKKK